MSTMTCPSTSPKRVLIEDTRQQAGKHDVKHEWWESEGYALVRSKMPFGDYCLPPEVAVDTKASLAELAYDIDQDHARFRRELIGARDAGVQLVVLTENEHGVYDYFTLAAWTESEEDFAKRKYAKRRIEGKRLAKACSTMAKRYGVWFLFCAPEESAAKVTELLYGGGCDEDG